jgi:hypothetical protein
MKDESNLEGGSTYVYARQTYHLFIRVDDPQDIWKALTETQHDIRKALMTTYQRGGLAIDTWIAGFPDTGVDEATRTIGTCEADVEVTYRHKYDDATA